MNDNNANNNIIRPPRLIPPNGENPANNNAANIANANLDRANLTAIILEIVRQEGREIINSIINPGNDINNDVDQSIDRGRDGDLSDMDRIPDVVKSLREFSGQPREFSSWKKSVERILNIYEHLKGTPKYYGILSVIRNKITGRADVALESYNTPLNWEKISKCLTLHYADKRDLGTLEYQMTTLVQRNNSIPEFYHEVYYHLSLILNKLSSLEMSQESLNIMTQSYRDKALDTFVRGLKGDLPRLLSMREPHDLPQALHLCLKLENVDYRVHHSHGTLKKLQSQPAPIIPPRNNNGSYRATPIPAPRRIFYPELVNNPQRTPNLNFSRQNSHPQQAQNHFPNNFRSLPPKPLPRPEPMDVDPSIHSRAVNYQNRPQTRQFADKRSPSYQTHQPNKYQRIHYTEQSDEQNNTEQYEHEIANSDQNFDQTLVDYIDSQENANYENLEELDDIYFLD